MQKTAQTELGDINSPHLDSVFWDIYDPLADYVSFDIGNSQPRELPSRISAASSQEPISVNRRGNGYVMNQALSPVVLLTEVLLLVLST